MTVSTHKTHNTIELAAIVIADDEAVRNSLMERVGVSRRISHVVDAADAIALRHELAVHHYDLAVLMLEDADDRLPACLLRYPDLRVLVVVPQRKIGSIDLLLQQGASDVVSIHKPDRLRHALSRMVDECCMVATLNHREQKIELQQRIHNAVFSTHPHAVMLRCGDVMLDANDAMQSLLGIKIDANAQPGMPPSLEPINENWKNWLSAASRTTLENLPMNKASSFEVIATSGERHNVNVQPIQFPQQMAQLISLDPQPIDSIKPIALPNSTQPLARESLNQHLQGFLSATLSRRYTAMLVRFPELESANTGNGVERTLQELSMNRASEALKRCFPKKTLLARASKSALLIVSAASNRPSRSVANRAHEVLGSLSGLTNAKSGIKINTLTLSPASLSANDVIKRLESRSHPA